VRRGPEGDVAEKRFARESRPLRREILGASHEHGVIEDKHGVLRINERLKLVPGHCDPTCNLHDGYVGLRNGKVEVVWPVSARGKGF